VLLLQRQGLLLRQLHSSGHRLKPPKPLLLLLLGQLSIQSPISRTHMLRRRQRMLLLQWRLPEVLLLTVRCCRWAPCWSRKAELLIIWVTWLILLLLLLVLVLLMWQMVWRLAERSMIWAIICIRITTRRFPKPSCTKPCHVIL
jgi:H+/Cl- antiporter ClcA